MGSNRRRTGYGRGISRARPSAAHNRMATTSAALIPRRTESRTLPIVIARLSRAATVGDSSPRMESAAVIHAAVATTRASCASFKNSAESLEHDPQSGQGCGDADDRRLDARGASPRHRQAQAAAKRRGRLLAGAVPAGKRRMRRCVVADLANQSVKGSIETRMPPVCLGFCMFSRTAVRTTAGRGDALPLKSLCPRFAKIAHCTRPQHCRQSSIANPSAPISSFA